MDVHTHDRAINAVGGFDHAKNIGRDGKILCATRSTPGKQANIVMP